MNKPSCEIEALSWMGIREPFSSLSHLMGAVAFALIALELIRKSRSDRVRLLSVAVFTICGIQQLLVSAIYHLLWPGTARDYLLRADVAAVFLLIAGSVTPIHAILFRGIQRWGALALVWSVASGAIVWRLILCQDHPGSLGIAFFLLCGWSCAATAHVLHLRHGWPFVQPVALSGLAYTLGAIVLVLKWPDPIPGIIGPHDIWHIAVLVGLAMHCRFISQFAAGQMDHLIPAPLPISVPASGRLDIKTEDVDAVNTELQPATDYEALTLQTETELDLGR